FRLRRRRRVRHHCAHDRGGSSNPGFRPHEISARFSRFPDHIVAGRQHRGIMAAPKSKRTAFVTGASYGVGAATALALARDGFEVAVSATRADHLKATLAKLELVGAKALPLALDLREGASIARAMAELASRLGRLDVLVNNAAAFLRKPALDVTVQEWDEVMATNLRGTFFLTQRFGRHRVASGGGGAGAAIARHPRPDTAPRPPPPLLRTTT